MDNIIKKKFRQCHMHERGKQAHRQSIHHHDLEPGGRNRDTAIYAGALTQHSQLKPTELARPIRSGESMWLV